MKYKHSLAIILSIIFGSAYYYMMDSSLPTEANCSWLSTPLTDYIAFIWAFIIIGYGIKYDNYILTLLGGSVAVEHIWQLKRK